jgi:hypothetical protein
VWIGFAAYVTPHLVELGAEPAIYREFIRTPYLHLDLYRTEVLQHAMIHRLEVKPLFFIR